MRILILNGPNLQHLGHREPQHYGHQGLEELIEALREQFPDEQLEQYQSDHEGELIQALHWADRECDGVLFNPAGYTHSSVALADAVAAIGVPVIELHISNIFAREEFRRHSYIAPYASGMIAGMGTDAYRLAIEHLRRKGLKGS